MPFSELSVQAIRVTNSFGAAHDLDWLLSPLNDSFQCSLQIVLNHPDYHRSPCHDAIDYLKWTLVAVSIHVSTANVMSLDTIIMHDSVDSGPTGCDCRPTVRHNIAWRATDPTVLAPAHSLECSCTVLWQPVPATFPPSLSWWQ
jgi:hypothetical protein